MAKSKDKGKVDRDADDVRTKEYKYTIELSAHVRTKDEAAVALVRQFKELFPPKTGLSVERVTEAMVRMVKPRRSSRADRLADALRRVEDAKGEVECLREELEEWRDNLPDSFRDGDKGQMLEEAIQNLEQVESSLDEAMSTDVEFPGMY